MRQVTSSTGRCMAGATRSLPLEVAGKWEKKAAREQGAMNIWLLVEMKRNKGYSTREGQRKNPRGEPRQMMKYSSSVEGKLCNLQEVFRLMSLSALLGSAVVRSEPGCCDWSGICR